MMVLGLGARSSQVLHHAQEHAPLAPSLPPVARRPFDRLRTGFCGPQALGASRRRSTFGLTKAIPLNTRRSSGRGLPWLFGK